MCNDLKGHSKQWLKDLMKKFYHNCNITEGGTFNTLELLLIKLSKGGYCDICDKFMTKDPIND